MKRLLILLSIIILLPACRKNVTTTTPGNNVSCWACAIEGTYNGTIVDIDTTICNKSESDINAFMAQHNSSGQVIRCSRALE